MDVPTEPRDMETMSMAACLNRIMMKVRAEGFGGDVIEELVDDFEYIEEKFGICPEEAALLSCVLEKGNDFCRCDDGDLADFMGCTNIEFIGFRRYLLSLAQKRIVRIGRNRSGDSTYQVMPEACQAIIDDTRFSERNFAA